MDSGNWDYILNSSASQLWDLHFSYLMIFPFVISVRYDFNYQTRKQVMLLSITP